LCCEEYVYVYVHISDCLEIAYELLLLANNTASETFLHKSGAVRSADYWIFITSAGLAVNGRIRDSGQNVLQFSFQTGSSNSPSYFHIFCIIAFLDEDCIRYKIYVAYSESKYHLHISLAHPRDCHFAHVQ